MQQNTNTFIISLTIFFTISLGSFTHANTSNNISDLIGPFGNDRDIKKIKKNIILCKSNMENLKMGQLQTPKLQALDFHIVGLHPKNCRHVLRKLSLYEKYPEYIGIVKSSLYDENNMRLQLSLSSPLLPFNMIMDFQLPRITKIGNYPFSFDKGFLRGLKGNINIYEYQNRCLFYTSAYWTGPHSGISPGIFELFSSTLSKMAMETLFRISNTY